MTRRNAGRLSMGVLSLLAIVAPVARTAVTPVYDDRRMEAEAAALGGDLDHLESSPGAPFAAFNDGISAESFGFCDANGEIGSFIASTQAIQDSFIAPLQISVDVAVSASLPDLCQLDTSNGYSFSRSEIGFVTDVAYRFIISPIGPFHDPIVQLTDTSGPSEVPLYDYPGSGPLGYDVVLPPGSYTFRVEVRAEEDMAMADIYVILDFYEVQPEPGAGSVSGLSLGKGAGGELTLDWSPSCSSDDDDYGIYAGDLGMFTSHASVQCGTSGATSATIAPTAGDRYYLVVPMDGTEEGSYGTDSDGFERTAGASPCGLQQIASSCP